MKDKGLKTLQHGSTAYSISRIPLHIGVPYIFKLAQI
jgi:hypothetical protein